MKLTLKEYQLNWMYRNKIDDTCYDICQLSLRKKNKDIYFIDKRNDCQHVSIHKDGSIWLTPQKEAKFDKPILIQKIDWSDFDTNPNTEKALIYYIPANIEKYPQINPNKHKGVRIIFDNDEILIPMIKIFIASKDSKDLQVKKKDLEFKIKNMIVDVHKGNKHEIPYNNNPPVLEFYNYRLRYDVGNIKYTISEANQFSYLFLCSPDRHLNIYDILTNNKIVIDRSSIEKIGFQLDKFYFNKKENSLIIF